ncbi:MAG: bifunctional riboflavin kinase/FMN adenylyltransferase [Verrucomicrobia bacterium]|nr:MAG: bifunctional riboflavin kinase/FMN adenylyltransferase [Verrucomicrobiota bacterium]
MNVIHNATDLKPGSRKVCLAIGVFDGVHLGHQQIIRQTVADARQHEATAVVVTFDKHPNVIVAPDKVPPLIYSRPQKIRAIESLGADALLEIPFTKEFSAQTGEQFIRSLARDLGAVGARYSGPQHARNIEAAAGRSPALLSICVGADFVFGHQRSGNVALLKKLGDELGFQVHGLAAVALDGQTVSSTRIREVIRAGDFDAAGQMLGRAYSFAGVVEHGDQLGHKLGFPTANLDTAGLLLPTNGVYAAHARVGGKNFRAVLNIGLRPTVQNPTPQVRVEVHLLEFSGELYGEEMEITFAARLRDEKKFSSLDELKA